ncbi:MAG: hypothetical protein ACK5M4_09680 [Pseudorhodobacter sp.]
MVDFEIHFTEGFAGEIIDTLVDGRVLATTRLQTRFQIGLAHVEKLQTADGEEVTLRLGRNNETRFRLDATQPFVTVMLDDGRLTIATSKTSPGYL